MAGENVFLLHAFLLGIFITFVYDLLRILRRVFPHHAVMISVEDLGFWAFCAVRVFLMMYYESNGSLRWFAVMGALAGMALYRKTVSPPFVKYASLLLRKLTGALARVVRFVCRPVAAAGRSVRKAGGKITARRKRFFSFLKKRLTASVKMIRMVICKR